MIGRGEKLVGKGEAEEEMGDDEQDDEGGVGCPCFYKDIPYLLW